jgi:hypothetical protein
MGEVFEADKGFLGGEPFGQIQVSGECNPTGNTTLTFTASGPAVGPFPGTFTETGTVTMGAPGTGVLEEDGPTAREVLDFDAQFTVDSELGQVTGTKSRDPAAPISSGVCNQPDPSFRVIDLSVTGVDYQATITTSTSTFTDSGVASVGSIHAQGTPSSEETTHFVESFLVSNGVVEEEPPGEEEPPPPPPNTAGKATGGGQLAGAASSSRISFAFRAVSREVTGTSGQFDFEGDCLVEDPAQSTVVRCLNVTAYTQVGTHATFSGDALVNGEPTRYTVSVDDLSEPNQGQDTFAIAAGDYVAGGNVPFGNIQVHAAK